MKSAVPKTKGEILDIHLNYIWIIFHVIITKLNLDNEYKKLNLMYIIFYFWREWLYPKLEFESNYFNS